MFPNFYFNLEMYTQYNVEFQCMQRNDIKSDGKKEFH